MYTLDKLKESETKMHARDIVRREQEQIELLMAQKAAAEARVKQLENENEFLRKCIRKLTN
jgi:cell division protein FtsB